MKKKIINYTIIVLLFISVVVPTIQPNVGKETFVEKPETCLLRGHIAYAFACAENFCGFVEFDLDDPGNLTVVGNSSSPGFCGGADFDFDGNMYAVDYAGGIYLIDTETGFITYIAASIGMNGLCFDTTSSLWYGTSSNCLYSINITTGASTLVGSYGIANTIIDINCDNDGNLYGYDVLWSGNSTLYSINKNTGQATPIGDMGYGFIYAQDGAYDRDNSVLYIAGYFNDGTPSALLICDTETGECTVVGAIQYGAAMDAFAIPFGSSSQYPTANFNYTPQNPLPGEAVLFDASSSYDPDGFIILYEWDWDNDGVYDDASANPTITHTWTNPGSYRVVLRVTDNASLTKRKTKTVTIRNNPPLTPTISGPSTGTIYHDYLFSLGSISDPESDSVYCQWNWGDGNITDWLGPYPSGSEISLSYAWSIVGVYEIKARLKDTYEEMSNWSEAHSMTIVENNPPEIPVIQGPVKGKTGVNYLYKIITTDIENDNVYYYVDWGDNITSGWCGLYDSGEQISASHRWSQNGTFVIKVKAKDVWGAESGWGKLSVQIPYIFSVFVVSFVEWLLTHFPVSFPILRFLLHTAGKGLD